MLSKVLARHSLKTRITVAILLIFLVSLLFLSFYATRMLRSDTERLLGEQQFATVSYVASEIDSKLEDRIRGLELNARAMDAALLSQPEQLHAFLAQRHFLQSLFNAGVTAYGNDGRALATASPGRAVADIETSDAVDSALKERRPAIGKLRIAARDGRRGFALAAPIFGAAGQVIGALGGQIDLDQPNFLDRVTASRYGKTGGYLVVAPKQRLIVTATDKRRIMEAQPTAGSNPTIDRFIAGHEGSAVYTTPLGVHVLGSVKALTQADWLIVATIPTVEAFVPIRDMQRRMALATFVLALLAGALTWWLLRYEFLPLSETAKALSEFSPSHEAPRALPIQSADEIGQFVGSFNRLLETLGQRNDELRQGAHLLREAQRIAGIGSYSLDIASGRWSGSDVLDQIFGIGESFDYTVDSWLSIVHPDDRALMAEHFSLDVVGQERPFDKVYRIVRQADGAVRWVHGLGQLEFDANHRPVMMHGTIQDVTERKLAELSLLASEQRFRTLFEKNSSVMLLIEPVSGVIVEANQAAIDYYGYSRQELIGMSVNEINTLPADDCARARQQAVLGERNTFQFVHRLPSGALRSVEVYSSPIEGDGRILLFSIVHDVTDRERAEAALRESHETLTSILATTKDGFWRLDRQGRLLDVNPAYARLSGYAREAMLGKTISFFETESVADTVARIARVVESGGEQFETTHRRRDGSLWSVEVSATFGAAHGGEFFVFLRDITERKAAEAELEQHRNHLEDLVDSRTTELALAKEAAEAANRAKSTFLANMSHEIRTPLNGIIGMTHILKRGAVSTVQSERLGKIDTAAKHLLSTINDILDLSKIEAGKVVLEALPLCVGGLLRDVKAIVDARAQAKGVGVEIEPVGDLPALCGDPTRLQQALLNYVGNAVKFTDVGRVRIRVGVEDERADSLLLRFTVEDSGIGISAEVLPRLFTAFEQADNSTARKYEGTGLGLAITRRLAQLMGGEAGVTSVAGVGSTFWFSARLMKSANDVERGPALLGEAETLLRERYRGHRILVVDDEPLNLEVARFLLEDVGLLVDTAEDGVEAVEMVQRTPYAAILMDMQMPKLDGVSAVLEIRTLACGETTPIVAMTANAFAEDKARCLEAGMNDFLAKPFNPEALYSVLCKCLEQVHDPLAADRLLLVGVPSIDQEHRELVAQLDRLIVSADAHSGLEVFSRILSRLGGLIGAHFINEENLFKSFGMPGDIVQSHVAAHAEILEQYSVLSFDMMHGKALDRAVVLAMVRRWIVDHVGLHDIRIKDYVPMRRLTD